MHYRLTVALIAILAGVGPSALRADDTAVPAPLGAAFAAVPLMPPATAPMFPDAAAAPRKSKLLAALYSAAVPGMGELYAGDYSTGRWFSAGEILLWLGYAGMNLFGNAMVTDAATFAAAHAQAQTAGKADQFLTDVGNFMNMSDYNDKKARDGSYRLIYTTADYRWQWDSDDNRNTFRSMHLRANNLLDNVKYVGAALVVNHLASAIDAVLLVNRVNRGVTFGAVPTYANGACGARMDVAVRF